MRRIIDYIQFNTEVDLLEYRLKLLDHVIDYFIVVESGYTFSGIKKNFYFQKHSKKFARFENKIIHVQIQDIPHKNFVQDGRQWENEIYQRDMGLVTGLEKLQRQGVQLNDDDLIVISDCDEILDSRTMQELKENHSNQEQILDLEMDMYYYDFRRRHKTKWYQTKVAPIGVIKSGKTAHQIRHSQGQTVNRGGWHLSYFGGVSNIKRKLMDFSHQEFNNDKFQNIDHIESAMMNGLDLFDREEFALELNDFTYMPLDWQSLRVEGTAPLGDLGIRDSAVAEHESISNSTIWKAFGPYRKLIRFIGRI
jgi:beta-1,4-mannosyl-glycoprotein beta-1,4-N-acetylglucosaminyltransferase